MPLSDIYAVTFLHTKDISVPRSVVRNVTRNVAVNVEVIKYLVAVKGPQPAVVFGKAGREGLSRPGNTGLAY